MLCPPQPMKAGLMRRSIRWLSVLTVVTAGLAGAASIGRAQSGQPPRAAFTYAPAQATVGQQVAFTSTSTDDGAIVNNEWDLDGDGQYGEAGEPAGPSATT